MTKLKHPFPDEPFCFNAFMVLFGREALRARVDMAREVISDNGSLILSPEDPEALQRMLELCAAHSGATVDEVKTFLANPGGPARAKSADKVLMPPHSLEEMVVKRRRLWSD